MPQLLIALIPLMATPANAQTTQELHKENALSYTSTGTNFACLTGGCVNSPPQINGTLIFCADCQAAASGGACQASGTGALAELLAGSWQCSTGSGGGGGGGVGSVGASSPLASTGGANPVISLPGVVPIANGGTGNAFGPLSLQGEGNNEATTGTTLNKLAKLVGSPLVQLEILNLSDTSALGIVTAGAGTTGSAMLTTIGFANCVFDGPTTAADYVVISTITAGDCHDGGAAFPSGNQQVLGKLTSTNASGGTYQIYLFPPEIRASAGGVGSVGASSPLASSGGSSPVISFPGILSVANGGTGSAIGPYLIATTGNNDATVGTVLNKLATLSGMPTVQLKETQTTDIRAIGVITAGAGTTGLATVVTIGFANCIFDNPTFAEDYVTISTTVAGDCHDAGAAYPSGLQQIMGIVTNTNASPGTYQVYLFSPEIRGAGLQFASTPVATLTSCTTTSTQRTALIVDNVAQCSPGAPIAGGGTHACDVVCDGTNWNIISTQSAILPSAGGTGSSVGPSFTQFGAANQASVGTIAFGLTKLTADNPPQLISTSAGDTGGAVGLIMQGAGTTGAGFIRTSGIFPCTFDGFATSGDYVGISGSAVGQCHDEGPTYPNNGTQVVGRVMSTGSGLQELLIFPPEERNGVAGVLPYAQGGTASSFGPANSFLQLPNSSTGTIANELVKMAGAQGQVTTTGDLLGVMGIAVSGAGTSGTATIQTGGVAVCIFDGSGSTAGDYVVNSTSVAGECSDTGSGSGLPAAGVQVIGRATTSNGAGIGLVYLYPNVGSVAATVGAGTIVITSASPVNCPATNSLTVANSTSVARIKLTGDGCNITLASPANTAASSLLFLYVAQDSAGGHGINTWSNVVFYSTEGGSVNDQPWYAANSVTPFTFTWDPTTSAWYRTAAPPKAGANSAGFGYNNGPHSSPGNLSDLQTPPLMKLLPSQWTQVSGDNAGPPQGSNQYLYGVWVVSYVCNTDNAADAYLTYKCSLTTGGNVTDFSATNPMRVPTGMCVPLSATILGVIQTFTNNHSDGRNWGNDVCWANATETLRESVTMYQNETEWSW